MPNTTGFYSNENKRERALKVISEAKSRGKTQTQAVQNALDVLARLDDAPIVKDYARSYGKAHQCATDQPAHLQRRHVDTAGSAFTIGSEVVPIQQPFTPEEIDERNGWTEPDAAPVTNPFEAAADSLSKILSWIAQSGTVQTAGLRAIALVVVTNPSAFAERCNGSMTAVAQLFGLQSKQHLQKFTAEIKDLTLDKRFNGHSQRYLGREKNRARALAYHKRVGHKIHATS